MIIIPDIHGRDFWKSAIIGHENEEIIFLGDYTDPYPQEGIHYSEGYRSLQQVIEFKKQHMDNVVLLLGNHDLSYISHYFPKCRHDNEHHREISELISSNIHLFKIAHKVEVDGKTVIFSHAGIMPGWVELHSITLGTSDISEAVDIINQHFTDGTILNTLGDIPYSRGGFDQFGSPVWEDVRSFITELDYLPEGIFQIFGHTQLKDAIITQKFADLDCRTAFTLTPDLELKKCDATCEL